MADTGGEQRRAAVNGVMVSLCVVTPPNDAHSFVSVRERDGWYLPAGRVDYGETFPTGAVRETLEEAGIPVNLEGILRIQHSFVGFHRFRVIFLAHPADNTPLKTVPDEETLEARWVTTEELATKRLRSMEVLKIFKWVERGPPVYPLSLFWGQDMDLVDHEKVVCKITFCVSLLFTCQDRILIISEGDGACNVPHGIMQPSCFILDYATQLMKSWSSTSSLSGVVQVRHFPPRVKSDIAVVEFILTCTTPEVNGAPPTITVSGCTTSWAALPQLEHTTGAPAHIISLASGLLSRQITVCPISTITEEASAY
ncbi:NUDIX hydrolase [Pelomyxa schiedti]|nr:NUDIX hydrolase [Pelomyxa schiedti]